MAIDVRHQTAKTYSGKKKFKNKRPRKKFLAVDVWRAEFGPVSVRDVYDVFQTKRGIETHNLKNYSFSDCVNYLRSLEDPDYIPPQDKMSY